MTERWLSFKVQYVGVYVCNYSSDRLQRIQNSRNSTQRLQQEILLNCLPLCLSAEPLRRPRWSTTQSQMITTHNHLYIPYSAPINSRQHLTTHSCHGQKVTPLDLKMALSGFHHCLQGNLHLLFHHMRLYRLPVTAQCQSHIHDRSLLQNRPQMAQALSHQPLL